MSAPWSSKTFTEFSDGFSGRLVLPSSPDYDEYRKIWNGAIDRRPALIARCRSAADVAGAVRFARDADLVIAVRSGGHSYPGHSVCEGGIVIDLAEIDQIEFGEGDETVRLGAGLLLGAVDRATTARGRVIPAGIVSHTGLAGLALGGGFGNLTRSHGMTCDQFLRLEVVTAAGSIVEASKEENPDLFWALQGGGGNFGIVTEFECVTHPLPPIVAGRLVYPLENVAEIVAGVRDIVEAAPRTLSVRVAFGSPLAEAIVPGHPGGVFDIRVIFQGEEDDPVLRELTAYADPLAVTIGPLDYCELQSELDAESPHGVGWYMKSGQSRTLSPQLIEAAAESALEYRKVASERVQRSIHALMMLGGAASDVPEMATAYPGRDARWHLSIEVGFTDAVEEERIVGKTRESWAEIEPHLDMSTSYVNMFVDEETSTLEPVYGSEKYARLREIKAKYDPDNLFRHNSNIPPAVGLATTPSEPR